MYKLLFAIIAVSATAFAALAPAEANSVDVRFLHGNNVVRINEGLRAELPKPSCWIKKSWKYDYSGNAYLKKVRICA